MKTTDLQIQEMTKYVTISWNTSYIYWNYYEYEIKYKSDSDVDWKTSVVNPMKVHSHIITGLQHSSLYTVKVIPYRIFNNTREAGASSQEATFQTPTIGELRQFNNFNMVKP